VDGAGDLERVGVSWDDFDEKGICKSSGVGFGVPGSRGRVGLDDAALSGESSVGKDWERKFS
jgi:hypothetical protein